MSKHLTDTSGFTLVEIILVMLIIVIVSALIITRSTDRSTDLISQTDSVAVHFRRGDYVHHERTARHHGVPSSGVT